MIISDNTVIPDLFLCLQVSLDLRAIARSTFNPGFVDRRGQPLSRRIGEFYFESKRAAGECSVGE